MVPILVLSAVGLAFVSSRMFTGPIVKTGGVLNTSRGVLNTSDPRAMRFKQRMPHCYAVLVLLKRGQEPDHWLINEAMCEAYDAGAWKLLDKLHQRFPDAEGIEENESEETKPEEAKESEPVEAAPIVVGKNSPWEGVDNDRWALFVEKLETEKPDYKGDRHVGRYYHSKRRLQELGIDPEALDADKQYDALVTDLKDQRERAKDLIKEYEFKQVEIEGQPTTVTLSGVLGLLKAAGPTNAHKWLADQEDRKKFPRTTKHFLETNGVF